MRFYYPNRPTLVPPDPNNPLNPSSDYIDSLEASGKYIAEFKWNGDNTTVDTTDMKFYNRQGQILSYKPHPDLLKELSVFPKGCLLNGELMHRHTVNTKDLLILHCIMAWEGKPLFGKTWDDSRELLVNMDLPQTDWFQLDCYKEHLLTATDYEQGFWYMFEAAQECGTEIEGIVLKNPKGKLIFSVNPIDDVSWMVKIRKPSNKYSF